jgi:hypothetical protein
VRVVLVSRTAFCGRVSPCLNTMWALTWATLSRSSWYLASPCTQQRHVNTVRGPKEKEMTIHDPSTSELGRRAHPFAFLQGDCPAQCSSPPKRSEAQRGDKEVGYVPTSASTSSDAVPKS